MWESTQLKGAGDTKNSLVLDMEMQNLELSLLILGLALVQYFLIMLLFLWFRMVMYILCCCMLEVCDLLFDLIYRRL